MTITPGSRLGPYDILAPLGAGGMGEVWRAKDTRVGRAARMLASLNHPGIAVLYAFEEIPSSSPSSPTRHVLAMELLEGSTLRDVLADSVPLRRATRQLLIGAEADSDTESFGFSADGRTLVVAVIEQTKSIMWAESPEMPGSSGK